MSLFTDKSVQPVILYDELGNALAGGAVLPSGTDRSGSVTVAGAAQVLAPANAARRGLDIQNVSSGNLGITENGTTPSIGAAGTYTVPAGGSFKVRTAQTIRVIGATLAQAWTATEY